MCRDHETAIQKTSGGQGSLIHEVLWRKAWLHQELKELCLNVCNNIQTVDFKEGTQIAMTLSPLRKGKQRPL